MSIWYLDTSAAAKLLFAEPESEALNQALELKRPELVACALLETELRRTVHRRPEASQSEATTLLSRVELYEMPLELFRQAGLLPGTGLRSLDALHLAAAMEIGADVVLTYDRRMAEAAHSLGVVIEAPGSR